MEFAREVMAVVAVSGLLGGGLYFLRHFQAPRGRAPGPLRAVARLKLSENLSLHLIDCQGVRCLVTEQKAACSVAVLERPGVAPRRIRTAVSRRLGRIPHEDTREVPVC